MTIRQETAGDYSAVHQLVQAAFAQAEHTDHDEHNLVDRLRSSSAFVPQLSLVAEENGQIVGHVLFTEVEVGESTALALAPLAVLPEHQGEGIGGQLIQAGHQAAKALGYSFSILVGHAEYYPRFGYRPAAQYGILSAFDVPAENFMACDLQGAGGRLEGTVRYAKEFGLD